MLYCPTATSGCVNEGLTDASLVTVKDPVTGRLIRHVKHFSGYNVAAGDASDPTIGVGIGGLSIGLSFNREQGGDADVDGHKSSGFMLASGREEQH